MSVEEAPADPPPPRPAPGPPLRRALAGLRAHEGQRDTVAAEGETALEAPPTPPAAEGAPVRVGEYRLAGELGRGGAGVVYVARSERLDRMVALKLLRPERAEQGEMRERFAIEARSAARLRHPNIVGIHEVGEDAQGRPFLVMELVPGRSLAVRLREDGPLPAREAACVAARLARALAYAHGRGILHRDVKPHNVLLGPEGEPLLTDFGLAKVLDEEKVSTPTVTGQVMGTPAYMPPEQARGEAVDPRSDVYSLGATLYELLCGSPPFDAPSVAAILARVTGPEPATAIGGLVRELDRDLATVCMRALEKDPADRYRSAAELAEDLERWLRDEPVLARPPGRLERGRKWLRRNPAAARTLLASLLVAAVLGATGGVLFLRRLGEERDRAQAEAVRAREAAYEAHLALDALVNEVQEQLGDLPGEELRQARARLLDQAAERLERLFALGVTSRDGHSLVQLEQRLGSLCLAAGRSGDALAHLDRSAALSRRLIEVHPRAPRPRWDLVSTLGLRADAQARTGQDTLARADLEEALLQVQALRAAGPWNGLQVLRAQQLLCRAGEARRHAGDPTGSLRAGLEALGLACGRPDLREPERSQAISESLECAGRALAEAERAEDALAFLEGSLAIDRQRAARAGESWQVRRALMVGLLDVGELALSIGRAARAGEVLQEALPLARRLQAQDPQGVEALRALLVCLQRLASWALDEGRLEQARAWAEEARQLASELIPRDAQALVLRDDESACLDLLGQIHERRGELELARDSYERGLALDRAHAARDASPEARVRVLHGLERLMDVRRLLGDREGSAAAISEGQSLLATLPAPPWELRSLFLMGRVQLCLDEGDLAGAAAPLEQALQLRRAARAAEPSRLIAWQALGWSLSVQADLRAAQGDRAGARASLEEAIETFRQGRARAPRDLVLRRGLCEALTRLGDLLAETDPSTARAAWEEALTLRRELAEQDRSLASRRDLLVMLSRLAALSQAEGDLPRARAALEEVLRAQRALGSGPEALPNQRRDLAVALIKAGEARQAEGEVEAAAQAFLEGGQLLGALAEADPGDVRGQRELLAAAQRLWKVSWPRRLDEAEQAAGWMLQATAAGAAPGAAPGVRRDHSTALLKRADVHQARGRRAAALADLRAALANHRLLVEVAPVYAPELERLEALLAAAEAAR